MSSVGENEKRNRKDRKKIKKRGRKKKKKKKKKEKEKGKERKMGGKEVQLLLVSSVQTTKGSMGQEVS